MVKSVRRGMETELGLPPKAECKARALCPLVLLQEGWLGLGRGENVKISTSMHISQHLQTPCLPHGSHPAPRAVCQQRALHTEKPRLREGKQCIPGHTGPVSGGRVLSEEPPPTPPHPLD